MADITRNQFNAGKLVQKKIFQKETKLTDADLNEQIAISKYAREVLLSALCEGQDMRMGDGFKVIEHPTNNLNQVRMKAGKAALHLTSGQAIVIQLGSDQDVATEAASGSGDRTDYIYLDLVENEIDSTGDENLINPAVGEETAIDIRLSYTIEKAEGSMPDPASGHVHIVLAELFRPQSQQAITEAEIANQLEDRYQLIKQDGSNDLKGNLAVDSYVTIDGVDVSTAIRRNIYTQHLAADFTQDSEAAAWGTGNAWYVNGMTTYKTKLRIPFKKVKDENRIEINFQGWEDVATADALLQLKVNALTSEVTVDAETEGSYFTGSLDISSLTNGNVGVLEVAMRNKYTGTRPFYVNQVSIDICYE